MVTKLLRVSLGLKVPLKDSIKWLPKSPKLYSGHNWSSQGSRWAVLKGKESFHGGNLYKFSSANGKWREGRISPEQEAEELEDPDDEPISKFSGSLFDTDDCVRDQRNTRTALQEKHKSAMKGKTLPGTNTKVQPPILAVGSFPGESGWIPEELRAVDVPQPPPEGIELLHWLGLLMGALRMAVGKYVCPWGSPLLVRGSL
ncbi:uncharacterized protein LJ206_007818 [Theristicus caerulescens]